MPWVSKLQPHRLESPFLCNVALILALALALALAPTTGEIRSPVHTGHWPSFRSQISPHTSLIQSDGAYDSDLKYSPSTIPTLLLFLVRLQRLLERRTFRTVSDLGNFP